MVVRLAKLESPQNGIRCEQGEKVCQCGHGAEGAPSGAEQRCKKYRHQERPCRKGGVRHKMPGGFARAQRAEPSQAAQNPYEQGTPVDFAAVRGVVERGGANAPGSLLQHLAGVEDPPAGVYRGMRKDERLGAGSGRNGQGAVRGLGERDGRNFRYRLQARPGIESECGNGGGQAHQKRVAAQIRRKCHSALRGGFIFLSLVLLAVAATVAKNFNGDHRGGFVHCFFLRGGLLGDLGGCA